MCKHCGTDPSSGESIVYIASKLLEHLDKMVVEGKLKLTMQDIEKEMTYFLGNTERIKQLGLSLDGVYTAIRMRQVMRHLK